MEGTESTHMMSKMWNWLKKEFHEILPVWVFSFFAMGLLSFTISAVLGKYHIELARPHDDLERLFTLIRRQHLGFAQATREILSSMAEPRYWAIMAWLIALIVVFCAFRELIDSIGSDRFKEMFFGKPSGLRQRPSGPPSAAA